MKAELKRTNETREEITSALNWRYATKKYDATRRIAAEDWQLLEEAMRLAPSSYGLQPVKFIVVEDAAKREKLKAAAYGQSQVTDASHLVVIAYQKNLSDIDVERYVERTAELRGQTLDALAGFEQMLKGAVKQKRESGQIEIWNSRQAYIALGFLLETAALLGIDATPMEGFNPAAFDEILGLEDYASVVICALGYRDAEGDWLSGQAKVRRPDAELIERV